MTLDTFQLGEPVEHRGIVVTPLFPRYDPVAVTSRSTRHRRRLPHRRDVRLGFVPELVVENPTDAGAALRRRGARRGEAGQILNVSVLVEAGAKLPIPVPCVEQGRWRRRSGVQFIGPHLAFAPPATQGADAAAQPLRLRPPRGRYGRGAREADTHARPLDTSASRTRSRRTEPGSARSRARSRLHPDSAAVLALGDDLRLDAVSRPDAFALLRRSSGPATCSTRSSGSTAVRRRSSVSRRCRRGGRHARRAAVGSAW